MNITRESTLRGNLYLATCVWHAASPTFRDVQLGF
jgi:hypothetical protein